MSLVWLDAKYLNMLSFRLRNFKRKGNNHWNFSCPICNDSKSNKLKARGYVFEKKGKLRYYCHNCNVPGIDVPKLVRHLDQSLYDEYVREKLTAEPRQRVKSDVELFADKMKTPKFRSNTPLKDLKKVSQLKPDGAVKRYIDARKIPPHYHHKLFLCKQFKHWVNKHLPGKFESEDNDEPRLIIPLLDKDNNLFGFQGRSFKKNSALRYITIMLDDSMPKLFGLDTVDATLPNIMCVEGPIDSMFLPNCIASAGSDIVSNLNYITEDKDKFTIIYDNEPRNKEICKKIEGAIDKGYHVCLWPDNVQSKDINDMIVKENLTSNKIVDLIIENTYNGLEAKLKFATWKKV